MRKSRGEGTARGRSGGGPAAPAKGPVQARTAPAGFTLIELLIVITIIGILAAMAIPALLTAMDRAKQTATATLLRGLGLSLEAYIVDNHRVPQLGTVAALLPLLRPYSETLSDKDDWKHPVGFTTDGMHYSFESFGKDGIDGANITPQTRYNFMLDLVYSDGNFTASFE